MSLLDTEIFFYPSGSKNRTGKGSGKHLFARLRLPTEVGLEHGSPIERSEASSEILFIPSPYKHLKDAYKLTTGANRGITKVPALGPDFEERVSP